MRKTAYLALLILFSVNVLAVGAQTSDEPTGVHVTWDMDDTSHAFTVSWKTRGDTDGRLYYDTEPRNGELEKYRYLGSLSETFVGGIEGHHYDSTLYHLNPDTVYYFVCGSPVHGLSQEMSFRTPPATRSSVEFVVGGDSRTNPDLRDEVSRAMAGFSPDFVLFSGDFVEDGEKNDQWDDFFNHMETLWMTPEGMLIPIVPAIGNHDLGSENYATRFALPGNEEWYSLSFGPDIHVIVLNSETDAEGFEEQTAWLAEDLEEHRDYPWKLVMFHRNVFKNRHEAWTTAFNRWVPLFDRYGVDIVFQGHSHNYMRSKPVNWTRSTTAPQESYGEGTMYLVSGAWGAPLYETVDGWWVDYTVSRLHYTLVDVYTNGTLILQAIDPDGEVFDRAIINKELPPENVLLSERLSRLKEKELFYTVELYRLQQQVEYMRNNTVPLQDYTMTVARLEEVATTLNELEEAVKESLQYIEELEGEIERNRNDFSYIYYALGGLLAGVAVSWFALRRRR